MIRIEGRDDHTPTRRLIAAIHRIDPQLAIAYDPSQADISIFPRPTNPWAGRTLANTRAWYDLYWTRQALVAIADPHSWLGEQGRELRPVRITGTKRAGILPPPPVIPVGQRLATTPQATINGMDQRHITLIGGREAAQRLADARRNQAVREDRTVEIYDWHALARTAIDLIASLNPPLLDKSVGTR